MVCPSRRELLRSAALGGSGLVAGCLSRGDTNDPPSTSRGSDVRTPKDDGESTPSATFSDGTPRRFSHLSTDDSAFRDDMGISLRIDITQPKVTTEHTAHIDLTLENRKDTDTTVHYAADCEGFLVGGQRPNTDEEERAILVLAKAPGRNYEECWILPHKECGMPLSWHPVELGPNGSKTWSLCALVRERSHHYSRKCMTPGDYNFGLQLSSAEDPEQSDIAAATFSIEVTRS